MLEKLKKIKFVIGKKNRPFVLILKNGLVTKIVPYYHGKYDFLIGWNVYSAVRFLFKNYSVKGVYRYKNDTWKKIKIDKIKELAYKPMGT